MGACGGEKEGRETQVCRRATGVASRLENDSDMKEDP